MPSGQFGFKKVNVGTQRSNPDALLNRMAGLICTRPERSEIGIGTSKITDADSDAVLGIRHDTENSSIIVINNLSDEKHKITLDLTPSECSMITELLFDYPYEPLDKSGGEMTVSEYGYRWPCIGGAY